MKTIKTVTALLFCCMVLLLAGCSQPAGPEADLPEPSFQAGEPHSNAVAFRLWFETMTSTAGPCAVSVQDAIYDEEQAVAWWYAIQEDLNALNQALGITEEDYTPFTVFIVEKTLHGIQVWNDYLYCTPEDILSGAYREGLIGAAFSAVPWKQVGIASCVFGAEEADPEPLAAYLADAENVDLLGLYAPYFSSAFASEEETALARTAARLLCEHVIAEHGGAALVEDACLDCRQELLDQLGVDRTYTDRFGGFDQGFNYSSSGDYPMIVTTPRGDTFNIAVITAIPRLLDSPADVSTFLYAASVGPQLILEGVETDAPEYAERIAQNYALPITGNIVPEPERGSFSIGRTVALGDPLSVTHEITHMLVPSIGTGYWKYEGCCDYLGQKYCPYPFQRRCYEFYFSGALTENMEEQTEYGRMTQKAVELYLAHADFPQNPDEIDYALWEKAELAVYYQAGIKVPFAGTGLGYGMSADSVNAKNGNELTYMEARVFVDYLVRNYSLSAFLSLCFDVDANFERTFGVDYETAKAAWVEELMNM